MASLHSLCFIVMLSLVHIKYGESHFSQGEFEDAVMGVNVPFLSGSSEEGHLKYALSNIKFNSFKVESIEMERTWLYPPTFQVSIKNARGTLSANYNGIYERKLVFFYNPRWEKSGDVTADFKEVDFKATATLDSSSELFWMTKCKPDIDSLHVYVDSGDSWTDWGFSKIINLILKLFKSKIKDEVEEQVCKALGDLVNENTDELLSKII